MKDVDGFVAVLDRAKDMVNRGGLKIYSAELENVLTDHPAVAEAAVVARPARSSASASTPSSSLTAEVGVDELTALCRQRLSDYKVPETWTLSTDPLPRNPNGKVDKQTLRARLLAELAVNAPA